MLALLVISACADNGDDTSIDTPDATATSLPARDATVDDLLDQFAAEPQPAVALDDDRTITEYQFVTPIPETDWPIDACAIDRETPTMSGFLVLASPNGDIEAISPQWVSGESCFEDLLTQD